MDVNYETSTLEELRVEHSVYYRVQRPDGYQPDGKAPPLIILCHGYGQSSNTIMRMFAHFGARGCLLAAPQAPHPFYWKSGGKVGFAWITQFEKENALRDLMAYLKAFVEDLRVKHPFDPNRVVVLGFSQGAALGSRFGTYGIVQPRGIISCGSDLPADVVERLPDIEKVPYLIIHGQHDESVPIEKGQEAEAILKDHGFEVTTSYFEGGHDLLHEQIMLIEEWIGDKLSAEG